MSLPRSVAEVLRLHVTLEVEGIDRMYPTFRTSPYDFPEFDLSPVCQAQAQGR
jgi:hypothetical protein